jgi:predicted transposase YbfD/YdcC
MELKLFTRLELIKDDNVPSHDTFRRVMMSINPTYFNKVLVSGLETFFERFEKNFDIDGKYTQLGFDGKKMRGSRRKEGTIKSQDSLNIVNVYDVGREYTMFSIPVPKDTTEVKTVQETLESIITLKNVIVSADAIHAQQETCKLIRAKKGNYVITLKENQKTIFKEATKLLGQTDQSKINKITNTKEEQKESGYIKEYLFVDVSKRYRDDYFPGIKRLIKYSKTDKNDKTEVLFFISSLEDNQTSVEVISKRWDIEINLHRYKDLLLNEDSIRYTDKTYLTNMAIINNTILTIIKLLKPIDFSEDTTYKFIRKYLRENGIKLLAKATHILGSTNLIRKIKKLDNQK